MWSLLLVTLPTKPNAVRLRIWRALKALGCAALRDGAYVLPVAQAAALEALAAEVQAHGGTASVLLLSPRDSGQRDEILALFDRSAAYAAWRKTATALQAALQASAFDATHAAPHASPHASPHAASHGAPPAAPPALGETESRRRLRGVADALATLRAIDHYPDAQANAQAEAALAALRTALDARFSPGEPQASADAGIARLDRAKFQGRLWASRARPWVDRLACAWLIRRFIDRQARFVWLPAAGAAGAADSAANDGPISTPRNALGFDYNGARFSHVGARVTFEVLMASFALDGDARLRRIAGVVHYLDAGGIPAAEAAGLEGVLAGLQALHADDDALAAAAATVFDALYAAPPATA